VKLGGLVLNELPDRDPGAANIREHIPHDGVVMRAVVEVEPGSGHLGEEVSLEPDVVGVRDQTPAAGLPTYCWFWAVADTLYCPAWPSRKPKLLGP